MISDKGGLLQISSIISVEGARWLQDNLFSYGEKISRQGKVGISNSKINLWMILYININWDQRGSFIELTIQVNDKTL